MTAADMPAVSGSDVPARPISLADFPTMLLPLRVTDYERLERVRVEYEDKDRIEVIAGLSDAGWRTKSSGPVSFDNLDRQFAACERAASPPLPQEQGAPRFLWCCERGCGVCAVKRTEFEYERTETLTGELVSSKTIPRLVSACCGADVSMWDDERGEQIDVAIEPMPLPAPPVADPRQAQMGETK